MEIIDTTKICQTFPEIDGIVIQRDYLCEMIEEYLKNDSDLIIVEGSDNVGKTVLLSQLATKNKNLSASYFITASSPLTYRTNFILLDLCNQIQFILDPERQLRPEEINNQYFNLLIYKLRKHVTKNDHVFYFLIDGLGDIPKEENQYIRDILDFLPIGMPRFKFVMTGNETIFPKNLLIKTKHKAVPVAGFGLPECVEYFKDLDLKQDDVREIYSVTKRPGYLASIKRVLTKNRYENVKDILENKVNDVFELEYLQSNIDSKLKEKTLAIIAYSKVSYTIDDISRVGCIECGDLDWLHSCTFLDYNKIDHKIDFKSESFRSFVKNRLNSYKEEVNQKIVDDFMRQPDSDEKLLLLPRFLEETGNNERLIGYLNPDYFSKMVNSCQSLSPVIYTADLGIKVAFMENRNDDLMRIGIQRTIITELDHGDIIRSEVEAKMALNDEPSAIALAQGNLTKEEKLHCLAIIAKEKREQGLREAPELKEEIETIYNHIDHTNIGDKAFEIAEELIHSNPELAIDLVEKATSVKSDSKGLSDFAWAKLSISAFESKDLSSINYDVFKTVRSKIKDPRLRNFLESLSVLVDEYDPDVTLNEVSKFENTGDKLIFLKQWLKANQYNKDAGKILDYSLNLIIKSTEYSPNARDYREIATPLPYIEDKKLLKSLLDKFYGQKGTIESLGPTEEIFRLDLILAYSELKLDFEKGQNRFVEIYLNILGIEDLVLKTACIARFLSSLELADPEGVIEEKEQLGTLLNEEFKRNMSDIYASTARQYNATLDIIRALGAKRSDLAFEISESLNTERSRDLAFYETIVTNVSQLNHDWDFRFLDDCIKKIKNYVIRDLGLIKIIEKLCSDKSISHSRIENSFKIIDQTDNIQSNEEKCRIGCKIINFLYSKDPDKYRSIVEKFINIVERSWEQIDEYWVKISIGFKIVKSMSENFPKVAHLYNDKINAFRNASSIESGSTVVNYISCINITIRAFGGLITQKLYSEEDVQIIFKLIEDIPSFIERARAFSQLSLVCFNNGEIQLGRRIVAEKVSVYLEKVPNGNDRNQLIITVSPSLYFAHRISAFNTIEEVPFPQRDRAYLSIIEVIFKKMTPEDPYEEISNHPYKLSYEEALDICEILNKVDEDSIIYFVVEDIVNSIMSRRSHNRFSNQQKQDIASRLKILINDCLPKLNHIKHDGYSIISRATVSKLERNTSTGWNGLIDEARAIPNLADKIFVLGILAGCMSSKERANFPNLITEAKELIKNIPSQLDRIQRYQALADILVDFDPLSSKECLNLAIETAKDIDNPEINDTRKKLVDLAYRIDPDFASKLTKAFDDDPARLPSMTNLKEYYSILENKRKLEGELKNTVSPSESFLNDLPEICWKSLGSLNAGRFTTFHNAIIKNLINLASKRPMTEAYPILCFCIQNLIVRHSNDDQAVKYIKPFFNATILAAELSKRISLRSSFCNFNTRKENLLDKAMDSVLIKIGEREHGIKSIMDMISKSSSNYVKICDPFFGFEDLDIIQKIKSIKTDIRIYVLTSLKQQLQDGIGSEFSERYLQHWRLNISDQDPPFTDIVVVGVPPQNDLPIHDRWIILNDSGVRVGTSLKSLGFKRDSEISFLSEQARKSLEEEIDSFISRKTLEFDGERVRYTMFSL